MNTQELSVMVNYTPALVRRAVLAYIRRGFGVRGLIALLLVVVAAASLVLIEPGSWEAAALLGFAVCCGLLLAGLYLLHYRRGMAKLRRMGQPHARLELTDTQFRVWSQAGSFCVPWSTFSDLWRFADFWLLIIGDGQFLTLPLATLTPQVQAFISAHIPSRKPSH